AVGAAVALAGCAALLSRPALLPAGDDPTARLVVLFVVLGAVGAWWPVPASREEPRPSWGTAAAVVALGSSAFVVGWIAMGGPDHTYALVFHSFVLNALAAVAEEAFFRRLLYGLLLPAGPALAVVGSAVAFAIVHVTVWGWWVLPLDVAAGLLLSWQRAASGRWSVPAFTHVLANTLALV
ncbi:MAG: lysostaphin resistance A-like protein, partial [Acidimicrobiales bacterium]